MFNFIKEGIKATKELRDLVDSVSQKTQETEKSLRINGVIIDKCFSERAIRIPQND